MEMIRLEKLGGEIEGESGGTIKNIYKEWNNKVMKGSWIIRILTP